MCGSGISFLPSFVLILLLQCQHQHHFRLAITLSVSVSEHVKLNFVLSASEFRFTLPPSTNIDTEGRLRWAHPLFTHSHRFLAYACRPATLQPQDSSNQNHLFVRRELVHNLTLPMRVGRNVFTGCTL
jgi:hypothetical protein